MSSLLPPPSLTADELHCWSSTADALSTLSPFSSADLSPLFSSAFASLCRRLHFEGAARFSLSLALLLESKSFLASSPSTLRTYITLLSAASLTLDEMAECSPLVDRVSVAMRSESSTIVLTASSVRLRLRVALALSGLFEATEKPPLVSFVEALEKPIAVVVQLLAVGEVERAIGIAAEMEDRESSLCALSAVTELFTAAMIEAYNYERGLISERSIVVDMANEHVLALMQPCKLDFRAPPEPFLTYSQLEYALLLHLREYDWNNRLRAVAVNLVLQSEMKFDLPLEILFDPGIERDDEVYVESSAYSRNRGSLSPLLRVLIKEHRLELGVWLCQRYLQRIADDKKAVRNQLLQHTSNKSFSSFMPVELNAVDDLASRLMQIHRHPALSLQQQQKAKQLYDQLISGVKEAY